MAQSKEQLQKLAKEFGIKKYKDMDYKALRSAVASQKKINDFKVEKEKKALAKKDKEATEAKLKKEAEEKALKELKEFKECFCTMEVVEKDDKVALFSKRNSRPILKDAFVSRKDFRELVKCVNNNDYTAVIDLGIIRKRGLIKKLIDTNLNNAHLEELATADQE